MPPRTRSRPETRRVIPAGSVRTLTDWQLRLAVRRLEAGGVIAYPTEAVYGLGCNPFDGQAVLKLLAIKRRCINQGLILIASRFEQLAPLLLPIPAANARKAMASWPGPFTWTWPCLPEVPDWLTGEHETLAVRVTAHPVAAALCEAFGGPLVSSSANRSGHAPARSPLQVRREFGDQTDYIIHGPLSGLAQPTRIRDVMTGRLLRDS